MAKRRSSNTISLRVLEDVTPRLKAINLAMRSPQVVEEIQRGAEIMAASARLRAPVDSGQLRKGIYTASSVKNNYQELSRHGKRITSPLKFPPRRGQVLIVASTYYGKWVEKGRKPRMRDETRGVKHERRAVGKMGRRQKRPFFKPGIKAAQSTAISFIRRRLERLVEQAYERGGR